MNPKEMEEYINYELREKHKSSYYATWEYVHSLDERTAGYFDMMVHVHSREMN